MELEVKILAVLMAAAVALIGLGVWAESEGGADCLSGQKLTVVAWNTTTTANKSTTVSPVYACK